MSASALYTSTARRQSISRARRVAATEAMLRSGVMLAALSVLAWTTFAASSLTGSSMAEHARQDAAQAQRRTTEAKQDVAVLRRRVDRLVSWKAIDAWAAGRGLAQPAVAQPVQHEANRH